MTLNTEFNVIEQVQFEYVKLESATLVQYYFTLIGKIIHIGYQ